MDLIALSRTTTSLLTFAKGGPLADTLGAVGGVHFTAAREVLRQLSDASDAREALNRVMTHLEAAHAAFERIWRPKPLMRAFKADAAAMRDAYASCLLAACHRALGDGPRTVEQYLEHARVALDYCRERRSYEKFTGLGLFDVLNPVNYIDLATDDLPPPDITPDVFAQFCKAIRRDATDTHSWH